MRRVRFEYAVSALFVTWRIESRIFELPDDRLGFWSQLRYSALSAVLGWWGVPWGPAVTVQTIWNNLTGGFEVGE